LPVHPVTVLVVDDDPTVRSVLCRTIEAGGYTVHAAADGLEALTLMAAGFRIDLVVTDLWMPRMDGRQLSPELAMKYPHVWVLFIRLRGPSGLC
jgi:CheY-like chemotaxis protein